MRSCSISLAAALAAVASLSATAGAQQAQRQHQPAPPHRAARATQAQLRKEARISPDSARAVAIRTVPGAKIESSEIEREHGTLIYSFDMRVAGKRGIEEVNVDAMTGALVVHEHESPKAEKAEAIQEARERTATKP